MNGNYAKELALAVEAAHMAGRLIQERLARHGRTEFKSCPSDLVTEVDRQCELAITEVIGECFPSHAVVGEEHQANRPGNPGGEFTWYVDPLDGTTNFMFGLPLCSVSIALVRLGTPVLGVVHDPFRNQCQGFLKYFSILRCRAKRLIPSISAARETFHRVSVNAFSR